jgi:hypothetical protein
MPRTISAASRSLSGVGSDRCLDGTERLANRSFDRPIQMHV